jgi:hypothetical protein
MRSAYRRSRPRRGGRRPASSRWLGWIAAALGVGAIAFIVGRAGLDVGLAGPTPIPAVSGPGQVLFGRALDPATGTAIGGVNRFRAGDGMAYSVQLSSVAADTKMYVAVVRLDGSTETTVQAPTEVATVVVGHLFGFRPSAAVMLGVWGPGTFVLRIYTDPTAAPLATGRFTLVESPGAS